MTESKENWEEKFDNYYSPRMGMHPFTENIKFFIRSLLSKAHKNCISLEKVEEVIEKMKYPEDKGQNSLGEFSKFPKANPAKPEEALSQYFYNQALSDLYRELLEDKKKEK